MQSLLRVVLLQNMTLCLEQCPSFIASNPESVNAVVRAALKKTYYDDLAAVLTDVEVFEGLKNFFGAGLVDRLQKDLEVAGPLRDFLKLKGHEHGLELLKKRVGEAFGKTLESYTPSVREFMQDKEQLWLVTEGAAVVRSFLLNKSWKAAPLMKPLSQADIDTWTKFEKAFGAGFGDAVAELNTKTEAEWEAEKTSISKQHPMLALEDLKKMRSLYISDVYYTRVRSLLALAPDVHVSVPAATPLEKHGKREDMDGHKQVVDQDFQDIDKKDAKTTTRTAETLCEKVDIEQKHETTQKRTILTPGSPGRGKRPKGTKLEGKQTVTQILQHGITQGAGSEVSGQVYVMDHSLSKVLTLTGMDASMAVSLVVSKEMLTSVQTLLQTWERKHGDSAALLDFEGGTLSTHEGQPQTHVRIDLDGGAVVKLAEGDAEATQGPDAGIFDKAYFVTVFATLSACTPPFTLTTEGVLFKFAGSSSGTGKTMTQAFYLQDENADIPKIVAYGLWAGSATLTIGNRVRIFFARVQFGRGDYAKQGTVWLTDEAYVHVLEKTSPRLQEANTISWG